MSLLRKIPKWRGPVRLSDGLIQRFKSTNAFVDRHVALGQVNTVSTENKSSLPFEQRRHGENFGQLVRSEHWKKKGDLYDSDYVKTIELTSEQPLYDTLRSPFRNPDGSFIQGSTAQEARLDPRTLDGCVDHTATVLPDEVAKVINRNILLVVAPDRLRERSALIFQSLEKDQIQKAPELSLETDAFIASLFLQNYSHARRALSELKKRVGDSFNPDSVLDVGYGPATGMVALNDIMGDDFNPTTKEVYVVGRANAEMKKRAKIILSRQVCENIDNSEVIEEGSTEQMEPSNLAFDENSEFSNNADDDYIGPVDASQINIKTKLRDALPSTKQYELIIVNQALLTREYSFPKDVDTNIHMLLRLLKPNGHLVLVERGNALGFEVIARAKQVMLRPEAFEGENGRIPRPYVKGSTYKPQKIRKEDQLITEDHVKYEEYLYAKMEREDMEMERAERQKRGIKEFEDDNMNVDDEFLEQQITTKFGNVTNEELKFEFEEDENFDVIPVDQASTVQGKVDYHLSVVAPCPHHAKCPLQMGDPNLYKVSNHKHRLSFCSFNQVVHRPKYTMELKRGRRLATQWDRGASDGMGIDSLSKTTLKNLEGSGRPGGNNTESGNFSYLIMHRSKNDIASIENIEKDREYSADINEENAEWPRILEFPSKIKNNVRLNVCSPSGNIEVWQIPKSLGKQTYHDARKVQQGDLWALSKKSVTVKNKLSDAKLEKLHRLAQTQRKFVIKEKIKQQWKKKVSHDENEFEESPMELSDRLASELESSKKYRTQGKRAKFDVNPHDYNGQ